jgi:hypothetical protein
MDLWELVARERIRDTLARYNWAGDAFRLDELADSFSVDGVLEIRGQEPLRGREAIIAYLGRGFASADDEARRIAAKADAAASGLTRVVRHNITNLRFVEVTPERAQISTYFTVVTEIGLDHFGRYRDELAPVGDEWLFSHRFVSTDWASPDSTMARPYVRDP